MKQRTKTLGLLASAAVAIAATALGLTAYFRRNVVQGPRPEDPRYQPMVSAFSAGVAALDTDANVIAQTSLTRATELIPEEPAAWADLGLAEIRLGNFAAAERTLTRARTLAPESGTVERFFAILESRQGRFAESIAHLRLAVGLAPNDLRARYALAQEVERQADGAAEALRITGDLLNAAPENLAVLIDRARLAAKTGDAAALNDAVNRLGALAADWPPRALQEHRALQQAAAGTNTRLAATRAVVLRNVLLTVPAFRQSLEAVTEPVGTVGTPIEAFLRLKPPAPTPAPPDLAIAFDVEAAGGVSPSPAGAVAVVPAFLNAPAFVLSADGREVRRSDRPGVVAPFPGGASATPPTADGLALVDWNSDGVTDLVLAGAGGVRILRGEVGGAFVDATDAAKLGPDVLAANAYGVWVADLETDGDLDLIVGLRGGPTAALVNHGDGTFATLRPFPESRDVRGFAWADFDRDGDPDPATVEGPGVLKVFANERSGRFVARGVPDGLGRVLSLATADLDANGSIDLILLGHDAIRQLSDRGEGRAWDLAAVARAEIAGASGDAEPRIVAADLDNNGGLDLVESRPGGSRVWLRDAGGAYRAAAATPKLRVFAVGDLNGDGRLDLAGVAADGNAAVGRSRGAKAYRWLDVRPRAKAVGDARINSFGVGGEVSLRAGLLVQTQVVSGSVVHFGLGERAEADVVKIVWPNGTSQAEFGPKADQSLLAEQRLKGSCPFLYADDGTSIKFVTDFLWRSPLGLRINAQDTAGVSQTEDWVKIRGDQLSPRGGFYDLRVTAELWETHYWDHIRLMTVDHPEGSEAFVDERFARTPPPLAVRLTGPLKPVAQAHDERGRDVTGLVRERDGRYLDSFGLGAYQGVTRDHWVEVSLADEPVDDKKLVLVASGWIHPTDSSINVALGQNGNVVPQGLVLETPTSGGEWTVARDDLGFPAGKNKTILIDLDGVFRPGAPRRLRLRTNLEVYWDALAVAEKRDSENTKCERLAPASAELRARGYSRMNQADPSTPELPDYATIDGTAQRWNDLIGFYTRFGDVQELLDAVDDRYVIANAGDELALRFPALPAPSPGWVRDFVLIGDGWNKDGDYNTAFSKTVLPLPSHDRPAYDTPPGSLEDDPVYRRHSGDWETYHTRYVTPQTFQQGLRPRAGSEAAKDGSRNHDP